MTMRILMVCMGNICRSPTAEVVLRHRLEAAGLSDQVEVDSAGTHSYHIGEPPDLRSQAHARRRGYELAGLRARRVVDEDFERFDLLLAMDRENLEWLRANCPSARRDRLQRLMQYAKRSSISVVPDPWAGRPKDFERVLDLTEDACDGLVETLLKARGANR